MTHREKPPKGADTRVIIQYIAWRFWKMNDVVFTGDERIRKAINLMRDREGREAYAGPIGWQGHFLFIFAGGQLHRIDMQSEPFDQAFTDLGYKESA